MVPVVFEFFFCFLTANFFVMKKTRSESGAGFIPGSRILWSLPSTDSMAAAESGSTNERLIWLGPYSPLLARTVSVSNNKYNLPTVLGGTANEHKK